MTDATHAQAVLFPGQGSQEKGMGRDLAEAGAEAKQLWIMAEKASGLPLREIYWEGEEADMAATRALQPAMTAVTLGLWYRLRGKLAPLGLAGHSLGEFAALAASGVLQPAAAIELVALRGRLMDEAGRSSTGKMAAVLKLTQQQTEDLAEAARRQSQARLHLANYNSPGQFVLSGEAAAIEAACALARDYKGRAIVLPVSGAFHSPDMDEANTEFAKVLAKADFNTPQIPVYLNVTGETAAGPEAVRAAMGRQMISPVQWIKTMQGMFAAGARDFVELGPKGVLAKLAKANLEDVQTGQISTLEAVEAL
ncbi:MAG: ACP S-malonyltransferase [Desulfovibrionaceae bacterium]|nr:ACP S-malonyltransferase [Desulfovibrionaceae bacterium]MBF0515352.1 ACP S-malonyltransferase [Desulfovibrionaceae bacterium]